MCLFRYEIKHLVSSSRKRNQTKLITKFINTRMICFFPTILGPVWFMGKIQEEQRNQISIGFFQCRNVWNKGRDLNRSKGKVMKPAVLEERKKISSELMGIFPVALVHSRTNLHTPYLHAQPCMWARPRHFKFF